MRGTSGNDSWIIAPFSRVQEPRAAHLADVQDIALNASRFLPASSRYPLPSSHPASPDQQEFVESNTLAAGFSPRTEPETFPLPCDQQRVPSTQRTPPTRYVPPSTTREEQTSSTMRDTSGNDSWIIAPFSRVQEPRAAHLADVQDIALNASRFLPASSH